MTKKTKIEVDRLNWNHIIIIVVVTLASFLPFVGKAFNIDDPVYIWVARHIQSDPLNFYGFDVNWYRWEMPVWEFNKNPPLVSYYLSIAAFFSGWGEKAIHFFMILPALAASLGSYILARRFTSKALLAALVSAVTPVFVISGTTVMSDMLMLGLWCWALVFWIRGLEEDEPLCLTAGGFLIAMSTLAKYYGICLIPLLAAYSVFRKRMDFRWLLYMLIPVIILAGYQYATHRMYGRGLLLDVVSYATNTRSGFKMGLAEEFFVGTVFAGGCLITVFFYAPLLWSRRMLMLLAGLIAAGIVVLANTRWIGEFELVSEGAIRWNAVVHLAVFAVAGLSLLALTAEDLLRNRNASSLFLVLWVAGTFTFAGLINWTTNGRAVLPMAPALGIILARKIESLWHDGRKDKILFFLPVIAGLFISLLATWGDYGLANSARDAAKIIMDKYGGKSSTVWFQGHWGFQYYMEAAGAKVINWKHTVVAEGDIVVMPSNNTHLGPMPGDKAELVEEIRLRLPGYISTMSIEAGAGFYASSRGPLPYIIGPVPDEKYLIIRAQNNFLIAY